MNLKVRIVERKESYLNVRNVLKSFLLVRCLHFGKAADKVDKLRDVVSVAVKCRKKV